MSSFKRFIGEYSRKTLCEDGILIDRKDFENMMREVYHGVNKLYVLRGHMVMNDYLTMSFGDFKPGSYFPSLEWYSKESYLVKFEHITFNLAEVTDIKFFFSTGEWMDFNLKFGDKGCIHLCFSPSDWQGIADWLKGIIDVEVPVRL